MVGVPTFNKEIARFGWMSDILNDFSQGFHKCKNFQDRTIPLDAQALPGLFC